MLKGREPWLGLVTLLGLVVMLLVDGVLEVAGLLLTLVPLIWGLLAWRGNGRNDAHERTHE